MDPGRGDHPHPPSVRDALVEQGTRKLVEARRRATPLSGRFTRRIPGRSLAFVKNRPLAALDLPEGLLEVPVEVSASRASARRAQSRLSATRGQ
jgi:hypothetical protein